ncbi:TetR/AcrR family transcriptional regulator [Streptomyces sp. NPDC059618]|uniref:TetR/AcrR family transcriptional regulator n=1 Tax=Streptomyces sp. NPDC059618 TaxID=3346887 RepID=UPI0036BD9BE9
MGAPRLRPGGRSRVVTDRVLSATAELLAAEGYAALNFQDIAKTAGVSRTTMYRRWPNCAALALDAITAAVTERIHVPDTGSLATDLAGLLRQIADFITSPLGTAALAAGLEMESAEGPSARTTFWTRRLGEVAPIFERARARGELSDGFDTEAALAMAAGAVYYRLQVTGGEVDALWIDRVVGMLDTGRSPA